MADDLDFDSFDNLDDLDWSELEKDVKENAQEAPAGAAASMGGGGGSQAAGGGNEATIGSGQQHVDINYLLDVNLQVTVEVGRRNYLISDVLTWSRNSVIELDKLVGEPLNVLVNAKPVAKGEVVVVNDKFAIKITEVLDPHDRLNFLQG